MALGSVVVEAAALVTSAAAVGTYRTARSIRDTMRENAKRSKENKQMLTGKDTHRPGLVTRVRDVEESVGELRRYLNGPEEGRDAD